MSPVAPSLGLNETLDELVQALEHVEDLAGFTAGIGGYALSLAFTELHPDAALAAIQVGEVYAKLTKVAGAVLALRGSDR